MKTLFFKLDKLGWVRLSEHFYMRQFLHSEISAAYGIQNIPDDPDLAVENGTVLCETILEPSVRAFGPIIIRSGFRSAALNEFGHRNHLMCASNQKNYAHHIWDHRDESGHKGASACIVVPGLKERETALATRQAFADWIDDNLPYHSATFFKRGHSMNIGWHERPKGGVYNLATSRYLVKPSRA